MKTRSGWLVKRGRTYYATWEVAGKRFQKTTGCHEKRKAETRLAEIMRPFLVEDDKAVLEAVAARIEGANAELAALDEAKNPPTTIKGMWAAYLATPNRPDTAESTLAKHGGKVERFVQWLAKAHPTAKNMRDVNDGIAEAYAQDLASSRMAPATYNAHIGLLRLVWRVLRKKARTDANPWKDISKKRIAAAGRRELTLEELRRVCAAADGELRTMLALGLYTGLRLGDCATLRWGETDLERGLIRRIPAKTARRNPKPVEIPIHPTLSAMLVEAHDTRRRGFVLPETAATYERDASAVCKRVQAHFEECGIQTHRQGTGFVTEIGEDGKPCQKHTGKRAVVEVGFHSLRHSFVSLCRAANVPLVVVESLVSHSSPAMTRHYSHTGAEAAIAAVKTLPALSGDAPTPCDPIAEIRTRVRELAEKLSEKTWGDVQAELLSLAQAS